MKQGDKVIKCNKEDYVCGVGFFDITKEEYTFYTVTPAIEELLKSPDFSYRDEYRKLKYKYVDGEIVEDPETPTQDEIDYWDFKNNYPIEKRVELQDEAMKALINSTTVPQKITDYLIAKDIFTAAESVLKTEAELKAETK